MFERSPPPVTASARTKGRARRQPNAVPGELQLMTMAAVQASIDGVPMTFDTSQGYLTTLSPGTHRLQISGAFGKMLSDTEVRIVSGERTQLRWVKGILLELGQMPAQTVGAAATADPPPRRSGRRTRDPAARGDGGIPPAPSAGGGSPRERLGGGDGHRHRREHGRAGLARDQAAQDLPPQSALPESAPSNSPLLVAGTGVGSFGTDTATTVTGSAPERYDPVLATSTGENGWALLIRSSIC